MHPVSAIVVSYNSASVLASCLRSLRGLAEIIVVDNDSADGSADYASRICPSAQVIRNRENKGFAAAVNQGARAATGSRLLICNPDIELLGDVAPLVRATETHAAAAGRLLSADGSAQAGFTIRRFPSGATLSFEVLGLNAVWRSNPVNRRYRYFDRDLEQSGVVEQPAGAFLMVRRDVFFEIGGFDEAFAPVWFEDVDFCRRLYAAGHSIWYESGVLARHEGAHSVSRIDPGDREICWYGSLLKYAEKHLPRPTFTAACLAVAAGAFLRMAVGVMRSRNRQTLPIYGRVFRLAIARMSGQMPAVREKTGGGARRDARFSHPAR